MTDLTLSPHFPTNLNDYAPWVAAHGLYAPYGECQCGCKRSVSLARRSSRDRGNAKGLPVRFFGNHNRAGRYAVSPELSPPPGAALIPLSRGKVAIVDAADYEWLMQWKWKARKGHSTFYALRRVDGHIISMHRVIMGVTDPGVLIDHANRNGLDNRRCNIRIATRSQNMHNRIASSNNTSGYKGVHWDARKRKWIAKIGSNDERKHLGHFDSAEDAARAYDIAALAMHGEFARPNSEPGAAP